MLKKKSKLLKNFNIKYTGNKINETIINTKEKLKPTFGD